MAKIRAAIVGVGNCASSLVQGVANYRAASDNSVGLPWLNDDKLCFLPVEGALFGNTAIRCCRLAMGGALVGPSAFFCKHPPEQFTDDEAERMTQAFIEPQTRVAAQ